MSSDVAIRAEGLGKSYVMYKRAEHRLRQMLLGRRHVDQQEFWALKDVSFEIRKGETVGIVGRNGSGKSTLLQIICGTLTPTLGQASVQGRIAALLELGAGFNPEFTGRENIFISATIAGYTQSEIRERFDRIADFAGIGDFIDQPVKTYSSGMYARLAFAVAINIDPDILVVDEVLAVGDEAFQRKCYARIEQIKKAGATILFVSHAASTIIELCDRAILFHDGQRLFTGAPKRAVYYHQKLGNASAADSAGVVEEIRQADRAGPVTAAAPPTQQLAEGGIFPNGGLAAESMLGPSAPSADPTTVPNQSADTALYPCYFDASLTSASVVSYAEQGAGIRNARLQTAAGERVNQIIQGQMYELACDVEFHTDCPGVRFYVLVRSPKGVDLAGCSHPMVGQPGIDFAAGNVLTLQVPFRCTLNPGTFFCNFAVQAADGSLHHRIVDALAFRVVANAPRPTTGLVDLGFAPSFRVVHEAVHQE